MNKSERKSFGNLCVNDSYKKRYQNPQYASSFQVEAEKSLNITVAFYEHFIDADVFFFQSFYSDVQNKIKILKKLKKTWSIEWHQKVNKEGELVVWIYLYSHYSFRKHKILILILIIIFIWVHYGSVSFKYPKSF